MNTTLSLIILLANQGYWFGGREGTISVRWAVADDLPPAVLSWDLMLEETRLGGGQVALDARRESSVITLRLPEVRVRTRLRWVYRLQDREGGRKLTEGERLLHVYPADLLAGIEKRLKGNRMVVCDAEGGLATFLRKAGFEIAHVRESGELQLTRFDMVLVAPQQLAASPFAQEALLGQARAGAGVLVFEQKRAAVLAGYGVARRSPSVPLTWRTGHPLLGGLSAEDASTWLSDAKEDVHALQLPADESALEIAWWAREVGGREPVPIDALLVTKAIGRGRLVLCQVPLGPWESDPRSQVFLAGALDYLLTRPEPTPPPSRRQETPSPAAESRPTLTISPGARP